MATSLVRQLTWQGAESLVGVVWDAASGRDSVMEFQLIVDHERGRVKGEKRYVLVWLIMGLILHHNDVMSSSV